MIPKTEDPRWLEIARKYEGLTEVRGPKSNPIILGWLQNEGKGKSWVKDDVTPFCGAGMAAWFTEAGLTHVVPKQPLAARNWREVGIPMDGPKEGCIVVIPRGKNPMEAHVGLLVKFTDSTLTIFGANQSDKVCEANFRRPKEAVFRWPIPIKTPAEIEAEGSRIAAAARRQQQDTAVSTTVGCTPQVTIPDLVPGPSMNVRGTVDSLVGDVSWAKSTVATLGDFGSFAGSKWPIIALLIAGYFAARIFWDGYRIREFRTSDQNGGWSQ